MGPFRLKGRFVAATFAMLLLVFCEDSAKTVLLDENDNNSHLCLYVGDIITVRLVSNLTTGYSWGKPEAVPHLELTSSTTESGQSKAPGAAGYQLFTWKASETGDSTLVLRYFRPFEKNSPPARTFRLSLSIQPRPTGPDN
jgi:inhibitor of cysteine peptidase